MWSRVLPALAILTSTAAAQALNEDAPTPLSQSFANLSLYAPVAWHADAEKRSFTLELGLVYSRIGGFEGVALNPGFLRVDGPSRGLFVGGLFGRAQDHSGVHLALIGGAAHVRGLTLVLWGVVSDLDGVGGGALIGHAKRARGVHLAGALGYAGELRGLAISGLVRLGKGDVQGVELSGLANGRAGTVSGLQIAGSFNLADDVHGAQIGLVNVAQNVRGLQLGLVNVAREVDGLALGLVTITRSAAYAPTLFWATADTRADRREIAPYLGLRTSHGTLYGMAALGILGRGTEQLTRAAAASFAHPRGIAPTLAAGARFGNRSAPVAPFLDLQTAFSLEARPIRPVYALAYRSAFGVRFGALSAFLGGGLRQQMSGEGVALLPHVLAGVDVALPSARALRDRMECTNCEAVAPFSKPTLVD
jgi:hypothetical protein